VELHGQHEHQALLDPQTHLPLLDAYAGVDEPARKVADAWSAVRTLREQLERSRMDSREKAARLDLIAFQLGEIEKASPAAHEDDTLAATRQVLASAERVQRLCEESYAALYESDSAALAALGGVWKRVSELADIDPRFTPYVEARDGIKGQLEDLAFFLRSYADGVDASPGRLQEVEDRLALLERLKRKYGPTLDDVIERGRALGRERDLLTGVSGRAEDLEAALAGANEKFLAAARDLSRRRRDASGRFARTLEGLLAELAMAATRFEVHLNDRELGPEDWSERGIDQGEFFLSPNPGEDLRPLARIVSGGELSRVMLALKTLAAGDGGGKTLIFDEVDAGIGGRVADVVGSRLQALGARFQVLCITHLPQIAARASAHFRIEKEVRGGRTVTSVEPLNDAARVDELARMIGGAAITEPIRSTAREMLAGAAVAQIALAPRAKAKGESESHQKSKRKGRI
jgi:DNA repair protein RecN (Recombination protein N)